MARSSAAVSMAVAFLFVCVPRMGAQDVTQAPVSCASTAGERVQCAADTSAGVALTRSTGTAPCLLGKSWGYDNSSIWVADGCSGEFIAGQVTAQQAKTKPLEHVPNAGFLLYDG